MTRGEADLVTFIRKVFTMVMIATRSSLRRGQEDSNLTTRPGWTEERSLKMLRLEVAN